MNKKTISIICLTLLYSIFFYEQHVGINFLLFTIATLALFFFQDKEAFKNKGVLMLSFAALFTSSFAVVYGSTLSLWATIITLLVLPGAIVNRRSNILIDFSTSVVNIAASTTFMIIEMVDSGKKGKGKGFLWLLKYIVPVVFIITFFFIYRAMNPLFENYTQKIAEIISLGFIFFTLGGFVLVYSIYKQHRAKSIDKYGENTFFNIDETTVKTSKWNEGVAFIILFLVLNLMMILVNAMDINYLYLGAGMPDGITHKQFLHHGVGMLILSIVLGISILLYFFRGELNFSKNKKTIKILAFIWVLQNIFMVVSTTLRNNIYVDEALLSYKRIGVYFWLLFALIGLITLFVKLYKNKTVWFLAKHNFTALFLVLVMSVAFDWDMIISNFNLSRARQVDEISAFDKKYMLSLSEGNIAGLYSIKEMKGFEIDSVYSYSSYNRYHYSNKNWLDCKVYDFLLDDQEGDWRSYSNRRNRVRKDIAALNKKGAFETFDLQDHYITSIEPIAKLSSIKELKLNNSFIKDWDQLKNFKSLETLSVSYIKKEDIEHFKTLSALKKIYVFEAELAVKQQLKKELPEVEVY